RFPERALSCAPFRGPPAKPWGGSPAGRASRSQCEGREFDPPPLHQYLNKINHIGLFFWINPTTSLTIEEVSNQPAMRGLFLERCRTGRRCYGTASRYRVTR